VANDPDDPTSYNNNDDILSIMSPADDEVWRYSNVDIS
jgi:hypothetical protein